MKEQAKQLFDRFHYFSNHHYEGDHATKQCCLIHIDEMIDFINDYTPEKYATNHIKYLESLKYEIEKL